MIGSIQDLDLKRQSILDEHPRLVCGGLLHRSDVGLLKLSEDDIKLHDGVRMFEVQSQKTSVRVSIPVHPCGKSLGQGMISP